MGYRWQWWLMLPLSLAFTFVAIILHLVEAVVEFGLGIVRTLMWVHLTMTSWIHTKAWGKSTKAITRQSNRAKWYKQNAFVFS